MTNWHQIRSLLVQIEERAGHILNSTCEKEVK